MPSQLLGEADQLVQLRGPLASDHAALYQGTAEPDGEVGELAALVVPRPVRGGDDLSVLDRPSWRSSGPLPGSLSG